MIFISYAKEEEYGGLITIYGEIIAKKFEWYLVDEVCIGEGSTSLHK